jgi:hypothetical protein
VNQFVARWRIDVKSVLADTALLKIDIETTTENILSYENSIECNPFDTLTERF